MTQSPPPRRPMGRPPGTKTGFVQGSVAYDLSRMQPNERLFYLVPANRSVTSYMGQIGSNIGRAGMRGRLTQVHALLVYPGKRVVEDVVVVECMH